MTVSKNQHFGKRKVDAEDPVAQASRKSMYSKRRGAAANSQSQS